MKLLPLTSTVRWTIIETSKWNTQQLFNFFCTSWKFNKRCIHYLCSVYRFNHWFFINPAAISSHMLSLLFSSVLDWKCLQNSLLKKHFCARVSALVVSPDTEAQLSGLEEYLSSDPEKRWLKWTMDPWMAIPNGKLKSSSRVSNPPPPRPPPYSHPSSSKNVGRMRNAADLQPGASIRGPEVRHRWGLMGRWTITLLICPFAESSQPVRATLSPAWWEEAAPRKAVLSRWAGVESDSPITVPDLTVTW